MGFEGPVVTPQIRKLISEHHIGSILLKASNMKCEPAISALFNITLMLIMLSRGTNDTTYL